VTASDATVSTGYPDLDTLLPRLEAIPSLDAAKLEAEEIAVLGRKSGALTGAMKRLATLPIEDRKRYGAAVNQLKGRFETAFAARREALEAAHRRRSRPGRSHHAGSPAVGGRGASGHRVVGEIVEIFRGLGFTVAVGPEVETEWYNFLALNFPANHPAMDMHDTLYLDAPPATDEPGRCCCAPTRRRCRSGPARRPAAGTGGHSGMVYRNDAFDASHSPAFSQIEGLAVDEGISFVDLKATLTHFARRFFSSTTKTRFRPSFFRSRSRRRRWTSSASLPGSGWPPASRPGGWRSWAVDGARRCWRTATWIRRRTRVGLRHGPPPDHDAALRIPDIRLLMEGDMRFLAQLAPGAADG
jgi:phenylalanyl-tRNA synthetase alpha chain